MTLKRLDDRLATGVYRVIDRHAADRVSAQRRASSVAQKSARGGIRRSIAARPDLDRSLGASSALPLLVDPSEQDGWRDLQGVCEPNERRDARITQSTLDPRDLGHVDARAVTDLFLRKAPSLSRSGDVLRKDIEGRHPRDGLVKLA
jgi:hypothetical protein